MPYVVDQAMRVDAGDGCSFMVRYAFASQRGYYPEGKPAWTRHVWSFYLMYKVRSERPMLTASTVEEAKK